MRHRLNQPLMAAEDSTSETLKPKYSTKFEFGRRLYRLMMEKGLTQSDLARAAGLTRNAVSTYVTGRNFPTPLNLQKIAKALHLTAEDLLPNLLEHEAPEDSPSLEMKVSSGAPNKAWLKVNRLVTLSTAARVIELIESDGKSGK